MSRSAPSRLERAAHERPETEPWLHPLELAARETDSGDWAAAVPSPSPAGSVVGDRPLLAKAVLRVDRRLARRWVSRLFEAVAARTDVRLGSSGSVDCLDLLDAGVEQSRTWFEDRSVRTGAEPGTLRVLAELAALPLLQACGLKLGPMIPVTWWEGYCPVCGAWPTLVEIRGVDRSRRLRCGRCGSDWEIDGLRCPFCGTRDHTRLGALVPEGAGERRRVETCAACSGYLKTLTTLTGTPGSEMLLEDLTSVDLDLAALAAGYSRPEGLGYPLGAVLAERRGRHRRLRWGG